MAQETPETVETVETPIASPDRPESTPEWANDLTLMPPEFWQDVERSVYDNTIGLDRAYLLSRQRQEDEESTALQYAREQSKANLPPPPEREPGAEILDPLDVGGHAKPFGGTGSPEVYLGVSGEGNQPKEPQGYLSDALMGIVRGRFESWDNTSRAILELAEWATGVGLGSEHGGLFKELAPNAETIPGQLVQGLTQFFETMMPVAATAGAGSPALAANALGSFVSSAAAFDPHNPRSSDLVKTLLPEWLQNPVTNYLATDPNDSAALGRAKNVLEDAIIEVLTLGAGGAVAVAPDVARQLARGTTLAVDAWRAGRQFHVDAAKYSDVGAMLLQPGGKKVDPSETAGRLAFDVAKLHEDAFVASEGKFAGSTVHPQFGNLDGEAAYAVSLPGKELKLKQPASVPELEAYILSNPAFRDRSVSLGSWYNAETGEHVYSATLTISDREIAEKLGKQWNQIAIWDLGNRAEIATGGTGEMVQGLTLAKALDQARSVTRSIEEARLPDYARAVVQSGMAKRTTALPTIDLEKFKTLYKAGKPHQHWYHGLGAYTRRMFPDRADSELFLDLMALASPGARAGETDLNIAIEAFTRYKAGEPIEAIIRDLKVPAPVTDTVKTMIGNRLSGKSFDDVLSADALKVRAYRRALGGDYNAVVVDRWMWRIFYPEQYEAAYSKWKAEADVLRAKGETVHAFPGWSGSSGQYRFIESFITEQSAKMGIKPADYQAAMWVGQKILLEDLRGIKPMRDMLAMRVEAGELGDLARVPGKARQSMVDAHTAAKLGLLLAATAGGYYVGDSEEESLTFALMAAGVSGGAAHLGAKPLAKALESERTSIRMIRFMPEDVGEILDPSNPAHRAGLLPGAEQRRQMEPGATPRLHYYMEEEGGGFKPESGAARGSVVHSTELPAERLYDLGQDPLGLIKQSGGDTHQLMRLMKEAGYYGFHNSNSGAPNVAGVWEPLGTRRATRAPGQPWQDVVPPFERGDLAPAISGGSPAMLTPDDPTSIAKQFREVVIEQRRGGVVKQDETLARARQLVRDGVITEEWVNAIKPGTTLNAEQQVAVIEIAATSALKTKGLMLHAQATRDPEALRAAMAQFYSHGNLDPKRIGAITEAGRAENILGNPDVAGQVQFLMQMETIFHDATKGMDPWTIVDAIVKLDDPAKLSRLAQKTQKPGFWQMFNEYYTGSLLWSDRTWEVNAIGGFVTTPWAIGNRAAASLLGMGREGHTAPTEAFAMIHGMVGSTIDAWRLAKKAFIEDERQFAKAYPVNPLDPTEAAKPSEWAHSKRITSENLNLSGMPGQMADFLGHALRFPFRVMTSVDDFFKVINYHGELRAQALRQSRNEAFERGLSGKSFREYQMQRYAEILDDPGLSVKRAANEFALAQTLQKELGEGGKLLQKLSGLPFGKLFLTFVTTPINAAKYASEATPLGFLMRDFMDEMSHVDKARADVARAKLAVGSLTMAAFSQLTLSGQITGAWPADQGQRKNLETIGWQPYSVNASAIARAMAGDDTAPRKGDTWVSYSRTEPAGMVLGLAADLAYVWSNLPEDGSLEETAPAITTGIVAAVAKNIINRTWFQRTAEVMGAIVDSEHRSARLVGSTLASLVPFSGALRRTEQIADPTMREARTALDHLLAQTPGFSHLVPPRRDNWSDPVVPGGVLGPMAVSETRDDPVTREMVKYDVAPPEIPWSIPSEAGPIHLTGEQRDFWFERRGKMEVNGKTIRQELEEFIKSPAYTGETVTATQKAERLHERWRLRHEKARDQMIRHFDDLRRTQEENRAKARTPTKTDESGMTPLLRSLGR